MNINHICRRAACLFLAVLMTLCLNACDDTTTANENEIFPKTYKDTDYANNPRAVCATAVGEKTVRVKFDTPVKLGSDKISEQILYRPESDSESGAVAYRMFGYEKDCNGIVYASVFEFDFSVEVNNGTLIFCETDGDGDRAMKNVLYCEGGAGLYATDEGKTELLLGNDEIVLPEERVMMIDATLISSRQEGIIQITFTVPVACTTRLTYWTDCVFFNEISSPHTHYGNDVQLSAHNAVSSGGIKGEDGRIYSKVWKITFSPDRNDLKTLPESGIIRIVNKPSFNLEYVCVAKDGRPLDSVDYLYGDVDYIRYN